MGDLATPMHGSSEETSTFHNAPVDHLAAVVFTSAGLALLVVFGIHARIFSRLDDMLSIMVNGMALRSYGLDRVVVSFSDNVLVKGFPAVAAFFYAWFQTESKAGDHKISSDRQTLLFTLLICAPAIVAARALAVALPFRGRPIFNPNLHLKVAHTFDPSILLSWSSFPSDHMVLFCALATGVAMVSWRAGMFSFAHALLIIGFPRLYLGVHYTSDLLVGALIGCGFAYLANWTAIRSLVTRPGLRLQQYSPGLFYAALFYLAAETANMYDQFRMLATAGSHGAHALLHLLSRHV
jgi:membrane-associated phospholipid phosphatase